MGSLHRRLSCRPSYLLGGTLSSQEGLFLPPNNSGAAIFLAAELRLAEGIIFIPYLGPRKNFYVTARRNLHQIALFSIDEFDLLSRCMFKKW